MLEIILEDLKMVFAFTIILLLARTGDIFLGLSIARKRVTFDKHKLFEGIVVSAMVGIGLISTVTAISILPKLLEMYSIDVIDIEVLSTISNLAVAGAIVGATVNRLKDCLLKFKEIAHVKREEIIEDKIVGF